MNYADVEAELAATARDSGRACGPCTACCTTMRVDALGKPANVRCPHAGTGCGIYPTRPDECRTYYCLWRLGVDEEDERPDRSGYHLSPQAHPGNPGDGVLALFLLRSAADVMLSPLTQELLRQTLDEGVPVVIFRPDGYQEIMWPDGWTQAQVAEGWARCKIEEKKELARQGLDAPPPMEGGKSGWDRRSL